MKFNFSFGNKKPDKKQIIIVSIVCSILISSLSQCTGIKENNLWDIFDEVQRKYFPQGIFNELIIRDDEKLKRRIIRDVDRAIDDVTPEYDRIISDYDKKFKPKYIQKPIDESVCNTEECKKLGGEMRICSSWVSDCTGIEDK